MNERELPPRPPSNRRARVELVASSAVMVGSLATMVTGPETIIERTKDFPLSIGALLQTFSEAGIPPQVTLFALIYISAVGIYDAVRKLRRFQDLEIF